MWSIKDKHVLVTGGTGSFGKRFIQAILEKDDPAKVVVFSRDELKQFEMQNSSQLRPFLQKLRFFIGDVRDAQRLERAMEGIDAVVHAAALKQVPACEYNPFEAIKTNVMGAQNVIDAAIKNGVQRVVALSTDKAAAPINLYGATKLASDKLFIAANNHKGNRSIAFSVVRYGNVMGSRGSVIPYFLGLRNQGWLPITDFKMTRFNITLGEGVDMVRMALSRMWGGELYVPKIPSYHIGDVAKAIAPECEHRVVGIRPGEKLHEEMITESDALNTIEFSQYYVIVPHFRNWDTELFCKTSAPDIGTPTKVGFCYNSLNNPKYLTIPEIESLLKSEQLIS